MTSTAEAFVYWPEGFLPHLQCAANGFVQLIEAHKKLADRPDNIDSYSSKGTPRHTFSANTNTDSFKMPMNAIAVGWNVTPAVVNTYLSHYINRKPRRQKPTAHITYDEGLHVVREVLHYAALHTVEDVQAFTGQWVPAPRWVKVDDIEIPNEKLSIAAEHVWNQLGTEGQKHVGGKQWWQWRPKSSPLKAEWIEMRKDYNERKRNGNKIGNRIMLYVHGGAYYFGSVDAHRYQIQRHARKLKARVLAPRYRLAPQFPFPCGLQDNLAAYLHLLESHDPSTILLGGDSAGGGMVLALLVTLRDRGLPLPAGAILLSPWVDLTHSFPSLNGDGKEDYIPSHGFIHKPSMGWPPPNSDDIKMMKQNSSAKRTSEQTNLPASTEGEEKRKERVRGFSKTAADSDEAQRILSQDPRQNLEALLSIEIDGQLIQLKDQIQLYATNYQILHPLVSPVLSATLGGLPPLLIISGGGELLKDEQIYLAHKAANPAKYAPAPSVYQSEEFIRDQIAKYPPTNVQFQLWDDLCHVATTLSFTRPAKYMFRSVAQFGAWALARAQKSAIDILDDDSVSVISSDSTSSHSSEDPESTPTNNVTATGLDPVIRVPAVGHAGDPIPPFINHMIRQKVDRHGKIYPLPLVEDIECLRIAAEDIGKVKEGPVCKWMRQQALWNKKFAKQKIRVQKQRIEDMLNGYEGFDGETPPPSALAGRRVKGVETPKKLKKSWAMMMWSGWGSKHDSRTIDREERADLAPQNADNTTRSGSSSDAPPKRDVSNGSHKTRPRSRSRHSTVTDRGQIGDESDAAIASPGLLAPPPRIGTVSQHDTSSDSGSARSSLEGDNLISADAPTIVPESETLTTRPTRAGIAYPFKLKAEKKSFEDINTSMVTLQSTNEVDATGSTSGETNLTPAAEKPS